MNLSDALELSPWPQHTHADFSGTEAGHWIVELDVQMPGCDDGPRRLRLEFGGVVQARINHDDDRKSGSGKVFRILSSAWHREFEQSYLREFGPKLIAVIASVRHFVVQGHDLSVGVLARTVEISTR